MDKKFATRLALQRISLFFLVTPHCLPTGLQPRAAAIIRSSWHERAGLPFFLLIKNYSLPTGFGHPIPSFLTTPASAKPVACCNQWYGMLQQALLRTLMILSSFAGLAVEKTPSLGSRSVLFAIVHDDHEHDDLQPKHLLNRF